ncbi:MAG TPA: hypothetical protein VGA61_17515 [Anaerolineae bacterium]
MRLPAILALCLLLVTGPALPAHAQAPAPPAPATSAPGYWPINGDFECPERAAQPGWNGTVPDHWHGVLIDTDPTYVPNVESTFSHFANMTCVGITSSGVERLEGYDSWVFLAPDIESTILPGKPFDAAMYQQVPVTPGVSYTLSGWMVSLCGGSTTPNDCPAGYYISKMLGLDPTGGTDPQAPTVQWVVNNVPHIDPYGNKIGWQNLQVAATATTATMTVFVRINSPDQHHGNMAFVDAVRMVASPRGAFASPPSQVNQQSGVTINWSGDLGPEIPALASNYGLYFDLQYRVGSAGTWQTWCTRLGAGSATFYAAYGGADYYFQLRPRAEQSDAWHGFWPHLPGTWTQAGPVHVVPPPPAPPPGPYRVFLPLTTSQGGGC